MLPSGWRKKTVLELGQHSSNTVQTGPFGSQLHSEDYVEEGVPFLLIRNIGPSGLIRKDLPRITERDATRLIRYSVQPGDIVFSRVGRVGSCFLVEDEHAGWIISGQTLRIRVPGDEIDPRYFFYALRDTAAQDFITGASVGSTRTSINTSILESLPIHIPPLSEQRKIARILTTVDNLIERTEALIAKYQALKQGLLHDLLTRGVDAQGRLRPPREEAPNLYKESPLGWIPREWEVDLAHALFEMRLGKMLSKESKKGINSFPYLANRNVQWDRVDVSNLDEMDFTEAERQKYSLEHGDLLICEGGEVGRSAIWHGELEDCYFQKAIHRCRPKDNRILSAFFLRYMRFAALTGRLEHYISQTSIAHLTGEKLAILPVPLPVPDEQLKIVSKFESIDLQIEHEMKLLSKYHELKTGLMQDLLTGEVRVRIHENVSSNAVRIQHIAESESNAS